MPSNHLILCHPLLLLPSIFPSIRVLSNESALCIRWPKYWSFNFNISPSKEHSGLISFRMDWLDLLAGQGTLKSLLQHHSSKASSLFSFLYSPSLTSIHDYWKSQTLGSPETTPISLSLKYLRKLSPWAHLSTQFILPHSTLFERQLINSLKDEVRSCMGPFII